MKLPKITYIKLAKKPEPYAAQVCGRLINRQCNESHEKFVERCEQLLEAIKKDMGAR